MRDVREVPYAQRNFLRLRWSGLMFGFCARARHKRDGEEQRQESCFHAIGRDGESDGGRIADFFRVTNGSGGAPISIPTIFIRKGSGTRSRFILRSVIPTMSASEYLSSMPEMAL